MLENDHTHGELIAFRNAIAETDPALANMTSDAAGNWILERTPAHFQVRPNIFTLFSKRIYFGSL